jgi:transcriptional regulator with XRE-family HTH domain
MGRTPRRKQRRLGKKLRQIRLKLKLSQSEIVWHMGLSKELARNNVSNYEQDKREPSLYVLLRYARLAGLCLDVIVDDDQGIPKKLPSIPIHDSVTRSVKDRSRSRK